MAKRIRNPHKLDALLGKEEVAGSIPALGSFDLRDRTQLEKQTAARGSGVPPPLGPLVGGPVRSPRGRLVCRIFAPLVPDHHVARCRFLRVRADACPASRGNFSAGPAVRSGTRPGRGLGCLCAPAVARCRASPVRRPPSGAGRSTLVAFRPRRWKSARRCAGLANGEPGSFRDWHPRVVRFGGVNRPVRRPAVAVDARAHAP